MKYNAAACLEFWAQHSITLPRLHETEVQSLAVPASSQWRIQGGGWGMHPLPPAVRHVGIFCR